MRKVLVLLTTLLIAVSLNAAKNKNSFKISFGDGGYTNYTVIDNSCYVYTLTPKSLKSAPKAFNSALTASLINAKKAYQKKADGFINIKVFLTPYKEAVIYQVCGDIVKSSKRRR